MTGAARPVLIVIAGPNGSGKTTITRQLQASSWLSGVDVLNPDEVAQQLFGDWNSPEASLEAARAIEKIREGALEDRRSIAFETVFSAPDKPEYVMRARAAGFFVRFFFVCTDDPSINARRVAARFQGGGHSVAINKVLSRYTKAVGNAAAVLPYVDRGYVFDNTAEREAAKLLFRCQDGRAVRPPDGPMGDWATLLYRTVSEGGDRPSLSRLR
jgi:predicted ABC-type ATPase